MLYPLYPATGVVGLFAVVHDAIVVQPDPLYCSKAFKVVLKPTWPALGVAGLPAVVQPA